MEQNREAELLSEDCIAPEPAKIYNNLTKDTEHLKAVVNEDGY